MMIFFIHNSSPKLPPGQTGEISYLGGAAPLSSRKIGYLLRAAHRSPIIFGHKLHLPVPSRSSPLNGFTSLAILLKEWDQLYFYTANGQLNSFVASICNSVY